MNKSAMIEHDGIVSKIDNNSVFVELNVQSACSGCHAKGICGVDNKTKIIEIETVDRPYNTGDQVIVKIKESLGMKAVFLGYVLPFLLVVSALIVFLGINLSEGISGLLAVLILIPYYITLYFFKNKIKREFDFKIEKI